VNVTPGATQVPFTHVDDDLTFPLPADKNLEKYVIYVGFDPQGALPPAKAKAKPQAKPKPKPKPAPKAQAPSQDQPQGFQPPASNQQQPTFQPPPSNQQPPVFQPPAKQ
jgi:hypothetical protein